jgi:hypothetical protein
MALGSSAMSAMGEIPQNSGTALPLVGIYLMRRAAITCGSPRFSQR